MSGEGVIYSTAGLLSRVTFWFIVGSFLTGIDYLWFLRRSESPVMTWVPWTIGLALVALARTSSAAAAFAAGSIRSLYNWNLHIGGTINALHYTFDAGTGRVFVRPVARVAANIRQRPDVATERGQVVVQR